MSSSVPIISQSSWVSIIPQFILMGVIIYVYYLLELSAPFRWGALTYLVLSFGLKYSVAREHSQGIKLVKKQQFDTAIPHFEKSVAFFTKYPWIDKYRYVTMLSSSKEPYKAMGLCNIAFCYCQSGDAIKAKEYYDMTLKEYPENGLAKAGLKMIQTIEQAARPVNQTPRPVDDIADI